MEKNRTFRIGPPSECLLNFILKLLFSSMEILSFNNSFHLKKNSLHKSKHLQPWAPISCLTMNHQSHFQGVGYQKKREVFISKYLFLVCGGYNDIKFVEKKFVRFELSCFIAMKNMPKLFESTNVWYQVLKSYISNSILYYIFESLTVYAKI